MSSKMRNDGVRNSIRDFHAETSVTDDAILNFFAALDCPRSLCCWLLFESGEHEQLSTLDVDPAHYNDEWSFRDSYIATQFLSKSDFLSLGASKAERALSKFFEFEELCNCTNRRFRCLSSDPQFQGPNVWLLNATIRKIEAVLGRFCSEEMVEAANWGPGVTTFLKGSHVSAVNKFHFENGLTHDLYSLVSPWFAAAYPHWAEHLKTRNGPGMFKAVEGNVIITVPKNSKTDRVIAVEPGVNLWFQKGVGTMIRRRLAREGIDLNDQRHNQRLARSSSKYGDLATVDFSSASDSISRELVRVLLPPRWFAILDAMRSKTGTHNNSSVHWKKFSSMGNGFTFELESLIFYAAACAVRDFRCSEGVISVYGDDVIIPVECYELFSSFSTFLGFRVNQQKSFSAGFFRESCGSHYYDGVDCKPIFLKERIRNVQSVYKLANNVRRLAHRRNLGYGCDRRFAVTWRHLSRRVPKHLRFVIPDGLGDGGFIGNFDEATPVCARHGIEGFYAKCLVETGVTQQFDETGLLLARLKVPSAAQAHMNTYTLRGRTRTRVSRVLVPQWYDLGPWQ